MIIIELIKVRCHYSVGPHIILVHGTSVQDRKLLRINMALSSWESCIFLSLRVKTQERRRYLKTNEQMFVCQEVGSCLEFRCQLTAAIK